MRNVKNEEKGVRNGNKSTASTKPATKVAIGTKKNSASNTKEVDGMGTNETRTTTKKTTATGRPAWVQGVLDSSNKKVAAMVELSQEAHNKTREVVTAESKQISEKVQSTLVEIQTARIETADFAKEISGFIDDADKRNVAAHNESQKKLNVLLRQTGATEEQRRFTLGVSIVLSIIAMLIVGLMKSTTIGQALVTGPIAFVLSVAIVRLLLDLFEGSSGTREKYLPGQEPEDGDE